MKTILVIVFFLGMHNGDRAGTSTWRKDMKTEAKCLEKAKEIKKKKPNLEVRCEAKVGRLRNG